MKYVARYLHLRKGLKQTLIKVTSIKTLDDCLLLCVVQSTSYNRKILL